MGNWCDDKTVITLYSGKTIDDFVSPFIKNTTLEEICFAFDYLPENQEDVYNEEIRRQGIKNIMTAFGYNEEPLDSSYWEDVNENEEKEKEIIAAQYKYWIIPISTIIGMSNVMFNAWLDNYDISNFAKGYGDNIDWFEIPIEDRLNFFKSKQTNSFFFREIHF